MTLLNPVTKTNIFTVDSIAESLASSEVTEIETIHRYFNEYKFDVVGLKENNRIIGYLEKKGTIEASVNTPKKFDVHDLITPNTDLRVCLRFLEERSYLFVIDQSEVTGIVTKADRQKPAIRMMFFGIITVFESQLASLIHNRYPNESWNIYLSEGRFVKARDQYNQLREKNLDVELIHSTQICDKTDILLKSSDLRKDILDSSKTQASALFSRVNELRNSLAHAHSLQHWFEERDVMGLIESIDTINKKIEKCLNE